MHTGRRRLGMERKRYVSEFNKRHQYCPRSGIYPDMLWYSYIYNRVHRLCWCTSWKYLPFVHGNVSATIVTHSKNEIWHAETWIVLKKNFLFILVCRIFGSNFASRNVCRHDGIRSTWQRMGNFFYIFILIYSVFVLSKNICKKILFSCSLNFSLWISAIFLFCAADKRASDRWFTCVHYSLPRGSWSTESHWLDSRRLASMLRHWWTKWLG